MRKWPAVFSAVIAWTAATGVADAAPIPVGTLFADFNAIINGNYSSGSEAIGPVLIGGNLNSTGILNTSGGALPVPVAGYGQVNVFGNNLAGSHPIVQNSSTFIGVTNSGSIINPGPGSVLGGYTFPGTGFATNNNALTFAADVWAPLTGLSTTLGSLAANSTLAGDTFTANPQTVNGVPNVAVFTVDAAQLAALSGTLNFVNFSAATGGVIINVTAAGSYTQGFNYGAIPAQRNVIWNFEGLTSLTTGAFEASILAPFANVTNNNPIEGDLIALNYQGNGELHFDAPCSAAASPLLICRQVTMPMPEPGTVGLIGAALVFFAMLRRRRIGSLRSLVGTE